MGSLGCCVRGTPDPCGAAGGTVGGGCEAPRAASLSCSITGTSNTVAPHCEAASWCRESMSSVSSGTIQNLSSLNCMPLAKGTAAAEERPT